MLPAVPPIEGGWPVRWPTDGRPGGVPDPGAVGPTMIQIGNDGGLLPQAARSQNTPVGVEYQTPSAADQAMGEFPSIVAITAKTLYLAPGERADVIVDFSQGPRRLQAHPLQRRPCAGAQRRHPRGLLHRRRGPDRHRRRAGHARRATDPTRARSCSSRSTARPRRRSTSSGCSARCRPPTRPRRIRSWSRRPSTTQPTGPRPARRRRSRQPRRRPPSRAPRRTAAGEGMQGGMQTSRSRRRPPRASPKGRRTLTFTPLGRGYRLTLPVQGKIVADLFDPDLRAARRPRWASTRRSRRAESGRRCRTPPSTPPPSTWPWTRRRRRHSSATPRSCGASPTTARSRTASRSAASTCRWWSAPGATATTRAPDPGELGWKDTLRVDPLESVLIAVRPVLPQACPSSCRPARGTST